MGLVVVEDQVDLELVEYVLDVAVEQLAGKSFLAEEVDVVQVGDEVLEVGILGSSSGL